MNRAPRRKLTIAILSFDRPDYLRAVLSSLKPQLESGDEVFLFQDGGYNEKSRTQKGDEDLIRRSVVIFEDIIASQRTSDYSARTFVSDLNLGIAGNYRRAEDFVFSELGRDNALFLEDDLVLGPHYLFAIDQLLALSQLNPAIGYVSAYGDLWASLDQQRFRISELMPMHENWGAALTRRSWFRQKPIRDQYWKLVEDIDYRFRDNQEIIKFFDSIGFRCPITSQDAARWIACCATDMVRLSTATCHARYIGIEGEHSTDAHYRRYGFFGSQIFMRQPVISMPGQEMIESWLAATKKSFRDGYVHCYMAEPQTSRQD